MSVASMISNAGLLGFAVAAVLYLTAFGRGNQRAATDGSGRWLGMAAFAAFTLATMAITLASGMLLTAHPVSELSGLLLAAAVGWLSIMGHLVFKVRLLGALVAPLATLMLLVQFFIAPLPSDGGALAGLSGKQNILLVGHIALAILGEAFAIIACAVAIFYLWMQSLLKKKLLNLMPANLPAIDRIDALLRQSLWSGFILITLGLLSGAFLVEMDNTLALKVKEKVVWAIAVWVWYLATLLARNVFNRPSKRIAQMSLAGFFLLALSYFGIGFMHSGGG